MKKIVSFCFAGLFSLILLNSSCKTENSAKVYQTPEEMVADVEKSQVAIIPQDVKALMDKNETFVLIDIRETDEHNAGFIPGSILIPRGVLEFRVAKEETWEKEGLYAPKKEDAIIVYCKIGQRSVLAAESLKKLGYTNVKFIKGGWQEWNKAFPEAIEKVEVPQGTTPTVQGEQKTGGC